MEATQTRCRERIWISTSFSPSPYSVIHVEVDLFAHTPFCTKDTVHSPNMTSATPPSTHTCNDRRTHTTKIQMHKVRTRNKSKTGQRKLSHSSQKSLTSPGLFFQLLSHRWCSLRSSKFLGVRSMSGISYRNVFRGLEDRPISRSVSRRGKSEF